MDDRQGGNTDRTRESAAAEVMPQPGARVGGPHAACMRRRGSESESELARRLARAREEAEDYRYFDYVVVNDEVDRTVSQLESIVRAERCSTSRSADRAQRVLATFPPNGKGAKEHGCTRSPKT